MMDTAVCTKCGEEKNHLEFSVDNSRSNGLSAWCRDCHRAYRTKNSERRFMHRLQRSGS